MSSNRSINKILVVDDDKAICVMLRNFSISRDIVHTA